MATEQQYDIYIIKGQIDFLFTSQWPGPGSVGTVTVGMWQKK